MKTILFEIKGLAPLKFDRWVGGIEPKNEEGYKKKAEQKVHLDNKGFISVPANAIKAAIRLASSEVGKKMMAKKNRQTIASSVFIEPAMLSTGKKKYDEMAMDIVTRKGVGDKVTRVSTFRPLIKEWKVSGEMQLALDTPEEFAKSCLELAGLRYGLLGHRPEFGRFELTKWQVKK